jgi:hypothetical protein
VDESNEVSQQQHLVLSYLLRLLDSLSYCPLDQDNLYRKMAENVMDMIVKMGVKVQFLFDYKVRWAIE